VAESVDEVLNALVVGLNDERSEDVVDVVDADERDRDRKEARRGDIIVRIELWEVLVVVLVECQAGEQVSSR
jgi:hypothetical protein